MLTGLLVVLPAAALVAWQAPAYCDAFAPEVRCEQEIAGRCTLCLAASVALGGLALQLASAVPPVWMFGVVAVIWISAAYLCRSVL